MRNLSLSSFSPDISCRVRGALVGPWSEWSESQGPGITSSRGRCGNKRSCAQARPAGKAALLRHLVEALASHRDPPCTLRCLGDFAKQQIAASLAKMIKF